MDMLKAINMAGLPGLQLQAVRVADIPALLALQWT